METREAIESDSDRIREIAEQSFQASYALSPLEIETILEVEFEEEHIAERVDAADRFVLVAEENDTAIGFAEAQITPEEHGEIIWIHVDPTERGQGAGTALFERILADLTERVVETTQVAVLEENREGAEFFERFEFEHDGRTRREFGDKTLYAELYVHAH